MNKIFDSEIKERQKNKTNAKKKYNFRKKKAQIFFYLNKLKYKI